MRKLVLILGITCSFAWLLPHISSARLTLKLLSVFGCLMRDQAIRLKILQAKTTKAQLVVRSGKMENSVMDLSLMAHSG